MTRQQMIDSAGKTIPNRHSSFFIIPFPHAIHSGICNKKDFNNNKTTSSIYKSFSFNDRIENFLTTMKKNGWDFLNQNQQEKKEGHGDIKQYIYENFFSKYTEKNKKNFFLERKNMVFKSSLSDSTFSLIIKNDKKTSTTINFTMSNLELWILDNNIAFLNIETSKACFSTEKRELTTAEISSKFNFIMRDFNSLNINLKSKEITHDQKSDENIFLNSFFNNFKEIESKDTNIFNLNLDSIKTTNKYYAIYKATATAKIVSMIHINEDSFNSTSILADVEHQIGWNETERVDYLNEYAYLLATFSDFNPNNWYSEANETYMYMQVGSSSYSPFKYWTSIALKDSITFFGIKKENNYYLDNWQKNEVHFIYMLNLYINYNIKVFEQKLIDESFTDIERHEELSRQMQRLKNEYFSNEIARRFQANELNLLIQKGMGYIDVYKEVESNISKTLKITNMNIANTLKIFGAIFSIILLFGDNIKNTEIFKYTVQLIGDNTTTSGVSAVVILLLSIKYKRVVYVKIRKFVNLLIRNFKSY